jgi:hypothetical protein
LFGPGTAPLMFLNDNFSSETPGLTWVLGF